MNAPTGRALLPFFFVALLFVIPITAVAAKSDPGPPKGPKATTCQDSEVHQFASDQGKNSPASFGPPVSTPENIEAVDQQAAQAACVGPTEQQAMLWATHAPAGPQNVDEINQRIAWSTADSAYRQSAYDSVASWVFSPKAKRQIVQVSPSDGCYWTLATAPVDGQYAVYQTRVCLKHTESFWQVTTPDNNVSLFKLSCHFQPAKLTPFNGVPTKPPTHLPPAGTPPNTQPPGTGTRPPSVPPSVPPTSPPGCRHNCTPPTTRPPGCRHNCTPPTTRPGKDPSQGIGNNAGAAGQGDTGHRAGGDTPANPPVETQPPATYGTTPSPTTQPPVTSPPQPPITSPVTTPDTAPD